MKLIIQESSQKLALSEGLEYHLNKKIKLNESVYRLGSKSWSNLVREVRELYEQGVIKLTNDEKFIIESDAGFYGKYNNENVPLDTPFVQYVNEQGVSLYGVFTLNENDKVVKIDFCEDLKNLKILKEQEEANRIEKLKFMLLKESNENYMFVQNIKRIINQAREILKIPHEELDKMMDGHQWAVDHISTAADDVDEVNVFLKNRPKVESFINEYDKKLESYHKKIINLESLKRWFKEKWVDISKKKKDGSHPPCGRDDADKGGYPKCRPSKKLSKKTPKVASSYTKKEKKSMTNKKRRAEKKGNKKGKPNYSK